MNKLKRLVLDFSKYLSYFGSRYDPSRQFVPVSWPRQTQQCLLDKNSKRYHDFEIRRKTTDWAIFEQIFVHEDYRVSDLRRATDIQHCYQNMIESGATPLILDCGANNGLSCAWFALTYPDSLVIGIEPEAANFNMAERNTHKLSNVKLLNAAVAANDGVLSVYDPGHGTSGYMTTRLANNDSHNTIPAYSIASIVNLVARENPARRLMPFIVNIDIEGFEDDLFSFNTDWIDTVPLIFIELHDWLLPGRMSATNFLKAIASHRRDFILRGENVISIANDNC